MNSESQAPGSAGAAGDAFNPSREPTAREAAAGNWIAWAFFLAVSWTWCIGMYLPVTLMRDFGAPAWLCFAVPNVLGAAAMGFVMRSRAHSLTLITRHLTATRWFSLVTIAFHAFFLPWMIGRLVGVEAAAIAFGLLLLAALPLLMTRIHVTMIAVGIWFASAALMCVLAGAGEIGLPESTPIDPWALASLALVCALGFITCPYLDLTFHRAFQDVGSNRNARKAFGFGFGVLFLAMIAFAFFYAHALDFDGLSVAGRWMIVIHLVIQSLFTVGLHAGAIRASAGDEVSVKWVDRRLLAMLALGVCCAIAVRFADARGFRLERLDAGDVVYSLFMVAYGLVFPAYVWLCLYPGRGYLVPTRWQRTLCGMAVVLASPFYYFAFIERDMEWIVGGVGIVLLVSLLQERVRRDFIAEHKSIT